ncbi:MAG: hypothetical protein JO139_18315 [Alphaproteobacteria bacterium]|nr:hypothetical protein [Alphaproteobacteria bacterium]
MTVLTKRLAAVSAGAVPSMGIFGPKRAGDRLAGSKRAWLERSGPSFADPTRKRGLLDDALDLDIHPASVGFVVLAVLVFWAMGGPGEPGLRGKGLVALTLGSFFTADALLASWGSSFSAAAAATTTRPIGRPSAKREGALSP